MNLQYILIFINLLVAVLSPFLPNVVYTHFVETYFGIVVLLILAFLSVTQGYLVAVSTFTAVAALYAEAHARKAKVVVSSRKATNAPSTPLEQQLAPAENLVPNEEHPVIETPEEEKVTFVPKEDATDTFKPVGESVNNKTALPTTSFSKDAEEIYLKDNLAESSLRE